MRLLMEGGRNDAKWYLATPPDSVAATKLSSIATVLPTVFRGLQFLASARRLAGFCREQNIQIIDCQTSKAHSIALLIRKFNPLVKVVVHRRVDFTPSGSWINRKKYLSTAIDRYVSISDAIHEILQNYGIPDKRLSVVKSAVDPSPFRALDHETCRKKLAHELNLPSDIPWIINVAYHTEQKGMETLIRGLQKLKTRTPDFVCLLAGSGHLTEQLKIMTHEYRLDSQVRFLGIRKDVPELLVAGDIFALPSNYEGLGTSILDALHSRCAVAASRIGGIPEMIQHDRTGLLSEVGDDSQLAINLERLIRDPLTRRELAAAGEAFISDKFSIARMVEGNLAVYRDVLAT
ncbi:glycosyltransferase family 4 protein [Pseudobacteriovorax antillogorgiicola]|uniref:Glycosyltransferase involved in cell wall bisynthesis n=1 Tax=Pseudobacteriovorax antillogorgiicola TaxID=1513793 RepID=A0A1Y6C7A9_9BACT|nr:glycosyltransferase family 4 protein [Pseudobacteriovorax antillogorgiicola]TCS50716.1 glycosyltransferase involved in cell wall biosynthesis [Pseudobacteriovorax antillogorgiicola]SMF40668.1 Glycosyltransferase involved in cell wall bisynthesis [Pseudobacteriovorax antillogorgiicola]